MRWLVSCRVLGRIFGCFFALAPFHLGFLKEPPLFCQPPPFLSVFDFVLSNQSFRGVSKDALIFTKFTNPYVFNVWRMVEIGVLLLYPTLTGSQGIDVSGRPARFLTLYGRLATLRLLLTPLLALLIHLRRHIWTCLCTLCGEAPLA